MTDAVPPCAAPQNDPQDWFISANGKQYSFDDLLTEGERSGIRRSVLPIEGETTGEHESRVESALSAAERRRKVAALRRRQAAKSKCWSSCLMRVQCLHGALDRRERHGTWGGMVEEEVGILIDELDKRGQRAASL